MLYGTGMRLREMITLCVKDIELSRREIVIREAKGGCDRVTVPPSSLVELLRRNDPGPHHARRTRPYCPAGISASTSFASSARDSCQPR